MYQVEIKEEVIKTLKKMDSSTAKYILSWIQKNLVDVDNPRSIGKPLVGNLKGYWRYRVGKYRIIAKIKDNVLIIEIIKIAKRDDVYE